MRKSYQNVAAASCAVAGRPRRQRAGSLLSDPQPVRAVSVPVPKGRQGCSCPELGKRRCIRFHPESTSSPPPPTPTLLPPPPAPARCSEPDPCSASLTCGPSRFRWCIRGKAVNSPASPGRCREPLRVASTCCWAGEAAGPGIRKFVLGRAPSSARTCTSVSSGTFWKWVLTAIPDAPA
uniref:Uncharacterized protein n=1 Tax=Myotis myotis TaxID=51298 RepID=A0A7J7XZW4_MYOMY|nr:hypothetical protein mMyoMyo1_011474 [Myotis myotis]